MKVINPYSFIKPPESANASRYFDGVSDYIDLGDSDIFSFGDGVNDSPFSVSAWIKMEEATTFRILGKYVNTGEWTFTTDTTDRLTLFLQSFDGKYISRRYSDSTTFNTYVGQWIHVVGTYDGSKNSSGIKLYINGSRVDDIDLNGGTYLGMSNTAFSCEIGSITAGGTRQYAKGHIADCRLYNSELSSTDIAALYGGEHIITNLVGHWIKDTPSLLDHSGTNDGTNNGSAFAYDNPSPAVEFGKASRYFNGVNDEVNLGDADDFSFDNVVNDSPFSISLWFKSNLPIGNIQTLVAKATGSNAVEYLMNLSVNGKITLTLHQINAGFGTYIDTHSASSYTKDKWHHAVVTYDGSLLATGTTVYFDGVDDTGFYGSGGTYSGQTNTTAKLLIGNRNTSSGQEMSGNIADVRIYNSVLSAQDVAALYNGTHVETNLVGHWLTNTDDVKDYAGVNDGTNFGSTYSFDNPLSEGEFGSASRSFNGTSHFINMGDVLDSVFAGVGKKFTIATWVKTTTLENTDFLSKYAPTGNQRSFTCRVLSDGNLAMVMSGDGFFGSNVWGRQTDTAPISANTWHHVAITYDQTATGDYLRMWVDGVEDATLVDWLSNGTFTNIYDGTANLQISGIHGGINELWGGNIADCRIYDATLSAQDIFDISRGYDLRTNLVGHWLTNADDVKDYAGTNDGINSGSTYSQDAPL